MGDHEILARTLLPDDHFDWVYVVDLVVGIVVAIFFLFYFNRIFASIISYAIRQYTWHTYRVYIDFQALQVSPLAGRVFFTGFRYHGRNETILINEGYITWRYWLRRVRSIDVSQKRSDTPSHTSNQARRASDISNGERDHNDSQTSLPCRISVRVRGLEWYIYNRTPAYDAIVASISEAGAADGQSQDGAARRRNKLTKGDVMRSNLEKRRGINDDTTSRSSNNDHEMGARGEEISYGSRSPTSNDDSSFSSGPSVHDTNAAIPTVIQMLPVKLDCVKGAIVLGNQHCRSVLIAKFDQATGFVDARRSSNLDLYKQTIDLDFKNPILRFRSNKDFTAALLAEGAGLYASERSGAPTTAGLSPRGRKEKSDLWGFLRSTISKAARSRASLVDKHAKQAHNERHETFPGQQRWLGLTRYMDDEDEILEQERWKNVEYAQFPTIVDSPSIGASIRWDVPGKVSKELPHTKVTADINGAEPPEWRVDLYIRGGEVHYGPWADRQRAELQGFFFPVLHKDAAPAAPLTVGQPRISTVFKLIIEMEERTTLVIHSREESKDWKWKGRATAWEGPKAKTTGKKHRTKRKRGDKANLNPEIRPYGWLDFKVSRDSTVSLSMDMVARSTGYITKLEVDLREVEMASSVNHETLWRSESQLVTCDLSNPLGWNTLRQWQVDVQCKKPEIFLLRDHIFLLTDLANDWSSGPPGDYFTFVPFKYSVNLRLKDYKLFLNANDSNIIDNPADVDENTSIVIWGKTLAAGISIPLTNFRPTQNEITFDIRAYDGGLELRTPRWNTYHTFLNDDSVALLQGLRIKGTHEYFTNTSPSNTDILRMEISGNAPRIYLYGFLVRYLMKIKDNYFGEDLHFRTLEEHQSQMQGQNASDHEVTTSLPHAKISNDLDVILKIVAERPIAILPARLYSATESIHLDITSIAADLRFTNYYMDLSVSISPITIARGKSPSLQLSPRIVDSSTQVFIDGLEISGHRLFGLPPTEPTYVCNWDFGIGPISGECSVEFLGAFLSSTRCFVFSFDDVENALPPLNPSTIHDITFLRLSVQPIEIWLRLAQSIFLVSTREITLNFNDWARDYFSQRMNLHISDLIFANIGDIEASQEGYKAHMTKVTQAYIGASVDVRMLKRKKDFDADYQLQQSHLKLHDSRTHRTPWLLHLDQAAISATPKQGIKVRPPAMQYPPMPDRVKSRQYLREDGTSGFPQSSQSSSARSSARKSSFLSEKSSKRSDAARDRPRSSNESVSHISDRDQLTKQLSKYHPDEGSARPYHTDEHRVLEPSSPYRSPYSSLRGPQLDLRDVPTLADHSRDLQVTAKAPLEAPLEAPADPIPQASGAERLNYLIDFEEGIRAFCTPRALLDIQALLEAVQLNNTMALLDTLQIDTMADVTSALRKRQSEAKIQDVNARVAHAHIRLLSSATPDITAIPERFGLDVKVERLSVTGRLAQGHTVSSSDLAAIPSSIHSDIDRINCTVSRTTTATSPLRAVSGCTISEPVLWMSFGDKSVLDAKFRDIDIFITPQLIENTSLLNLRNLEKAQTMAQGFSHIAHTENDRHRRLVYFLMTNEQGVSDPAFLTRASYVLRGATNHLRTCDSWKMVSRLRSILNSLSSSNKGDLFEHHQEELVELPEDARAKVIKSFEHWRAWDVTHVEESLLMLKIFGKNSSSPSDDPRLSPPFQAWIRTNSIKLMIRTRNDPNEFIVDRFVFALDHTSLPTSVRPGSRGGNQLPFAGSNVQAGCARFTASLNWDLCDIVETLRNSLNSPSFAEDITVPSATTSFSANQSSSASREIHAVLSVETSVVSLDSPNLHHTSFCQSLKLSSLFPAARSRKAMNVLVAADTATSEVTDRSKVLMQSKLRSPAVFTSLENRTTLTRSYDSVKIAASCDSFSQKALQGPLTLVKTVDVLLKDEVLRIRQLLTSFSTRMRIERQQMPSKSKSEITKREIHVTLFVNSYMVSLVILPSLNYWVSGKVARTTIIHDSRQETKTLVDFDLKDHSHMFIASGKGTAEEIAALEIPPINGCLKVNIVPEQKSLIFHTMIGSIQLDASAIHTLAVTVGRPEIRELFTDVQREVSLLSQHFDDLSSVSRTKANNEISANSALLFDAHLLIAGLSVQASSPTSSAAANVARLHFNLGRVQMKGTNRMPDAGPALDVPELEIRLNTIQASLARVADAEEYPSGDMAVTALLKQSSRIESKADQRIRAYQAMVSMFEVNINAETPRMLIDIVGHLQDTINTIEMSSEIDRLKTLSRTRLRSEVILPASKEPDMIGSTALFGALYSLEVTHLRVSWNIGNTTSISPGREAEDLVVSIGKIDLSTKRDNAARLLIENFQLQMAPASKAMLGRSSNSALLPEVVFNVAYLPTGKDRRLAFQAAGKSLDLQLTSQFIIPAGNLRRSIAYALQEVRDATANWNASANIKGTQKTPLFGEKKFASVLVDADFAGAIVYIEGRSVAETQIPNLQTLRSKRMPQHGRYNQFTPGNASSSTTLRAPGLAFKIEYKDTDAAKRSLSAEVKVDASSNVLHPTVVPLIMEISSSVKEMIYEPENIERPQDLESKPSKLLDDDRLLSADPSTVFGNCRVNLGLRICKQEFSLTCQPVTQVDAFAHFEDIYVTINTLQSSEYGQFYTLSAACKKLQASVQHAYSRDPTGSFDVESILVSLMSSKHVSDADGLSVILKISPMKASINARQLQDFLLFREIWTPPEMHHSPAVNTPSPSAEPQELIVQRYQQIAATGAFPWDAIAVITQLDVQLDLGQSLGRSVLVISNLWMSSKKSSDWEQNLCLGFDKIGIDSTGRMSGLVELQNLRVRTSIQWPMAERASNHTPLIQASLAFEQLRVKAAFDYQAFAVTNITTIEFLMYNVRDLDNGGSDRLVCIVRGDKVQAFCTATSASQGLALYQTFERLIQEKQVAYETSLKDIERYLRRRSAVSPLSLHGGPERAVARFDNTSKIPIKLQTRVMVRLGALNLGVYPSTFSDNQVFKIEAFDASARFSVLLDHEKIQSGLSLTLGQLRVALSGFNRPSSPKKLGEIAIDDVVVCTADARGGTILKVPKVIATMQTWQLPESTHIDYIFKSSFQGNIDVGWNYSRISFIRGMFSNHSRALAQRLGKPLPQSAVQITGGLQPEGGQDGTPGEGQEKITAVVNVPLSRYQYTALEEPVIDTPKLTQLGDATPPLEWIGLHRERLPNLTHQIVIVSLLEVAKEVEDAYTRILGSS